MPLTGEFNIFTYVFADKERLLPFWYLFFICFMTLFCYFILQLLPCLHSTSPLWRTCGRVASLAFLHLMLQWKSLKMCYFTHLQVYLWVNFYNWKISCSWDDADRNRKPGRNPLFFPLLSSAPLGLPIGGGNREPASMGSGKCNVQSSGLKSQNRAEWAWRRQNKGK